MTTLEAPSALPPIDPDEPAGLAQIPLEDVLAVVRSNAELVDREARFPTESVQALKSAGLLSASVPTSLGGAGLTLTELATVGRALGGECASTAMIYAMHHTQVLSLTRQPPARSSAVIRGEP